MIENILEACKHNLIISDALTKADSILNSDKYKNIYCSVSGGSDSDIVIDICEKVAKGKVRYVFFDTGIEYLASRNHLKYLEDEYEISITKANAAIPVPVGTRKFGQPFINKTVSEFVGRLQDHGFDFIERSYEEDLRRCPKCKSALAWWHNKNTTIFNIARHRYLKEFILVNPPAFKISNKCCKGAKKDVSKQFQKEHDVDLMIVGVRRAEGGARAIAYKNCFSTKKGVSQYRPIFWFTDRDKKEYEKMFSIEHSACYKEYGLKRTGCAGCPYGRNLEDELNIISTHEPKLFATAKKIFKDSYEYTKRYKEFTKRKGVEV